LAIEHPPDPRERVATTNRFNTLTIGVCHRQSALTHELRFARMASGARIAWARSGRAGGPVLLRAAHWMTHVDHACHF
jgi:hypothetical protein